jgi:cell division protein FtsW (lipid II flippase)
MSDETISYHDYSEKSDDWSFQHHMEPDKPIHQKQENRLKRRLLFLLIMLCYAFTITDYLSAMVKNTTPLLSGNDFFVGYSGTFLLLGLILSSLVTGFLVYRFEGLVLAFFCCILAPVAVFFLIIFIVDTIQEWFETIKIQKLSPAEKKRIFEEQLSLDYKYSSRGP